MPTVSIVGTNFVSLAKAYAASLGYPDLPMVIVPHPFETLSRDEVRAIAERSFAAIVGAVTRADVPAAAGD